MKRARKKKSALQSAMSALGSAGGTATFRKHGRAHMVTLVNKRWAQRRKQAKKRATV